MEKLDSRVLRSCANPLSLCSEQGGPNSCWVALRAPPFLVALKVDAQRASDPGQPKPEWRLGGKAESETELFVPALWNCINDEIFGIFIVSG